MKSGITKILSEEPSILEDGEGLDFAIASVVQYQAELARELKLCRKWLQRAGEVRQSGEGPLFTNATAKAEAAA
jgi:hypothetical protein